MENKLEGLLKLIEDSWYNPDLNAVRVMLAGVTAHYLPTDPLWVFLIAPPSSLKTEFINTLASIEDVYQLSDLTPQTFASGMKVKNNPSLLLKLTDNIMTIKDFTTVLTMRWDDRQKILSQLREIYDGSYKKAFGTGVVIDWHGKLGMVAGVTPVIDTHSTIYQLLGERFIQYRLKKASEEELAYRAMKTLGKEAKIRNAVMEKTQDYFYKLFPNIPKDLDEVVFDEKYYNGLKHLATFCVRARSGVVRDSYSKQLVYVPPPEAPARLAKQLATLCYGLAIIEGRKEVLPRDYLLTVKVGFDSVPKQRTKVINYLCGSEVAPLPEYSTSKISKGIGYSTNGARIILEDLSAHKLVEVHKDINIHKWNISDLGIDLLQGIVTPVKGIISDILAKNKGFAYKKIFKMAEK